MTHTERAAFKKRVMEDIEHYGIPVYNFPFDHEEDDEETIQDNSELRGLMPFAIVGSDEEVVINGEPVRARTYPWGIVEVDNPKHSDFSRLRSALLSTHLTDLKEITHDFLYENYRTEKVISPSDLPAARAETDPPVTPVSLSGSSLAQYTPTTQTLPFQAKSSQTSLSSSKRISCDEKRRSFARSSSRFSERFRRRDRSSWPRRNHSEISSPGSLRKGRRLRRSRLPAENSSKPFPSRDTALRLSLSSLAFYTRTLPFSPARIMPFSLCSPTTSRPFPFSILCSICTFSSALRSCDDIQNMPTQISAPQ